MFLVTVPISTCFPRKSYTVSYGESCFIVLDVCYFFFQVYHMYPGTVIHDKFLAVMLLVDDFFINSLS